MRLTSLDGPRLSSPRYSYYELLSALNRRIDLSERLRSMSNDTL